MSVAVDAATVGYSPAADRRDAHLIALPPGAPQRGAWQPGALEPGTAQQDGFPTHHAPVDVEIPLWCGARYDHLLAAYIAPRPSLSILEIGVARASTAMRMLAFADALGGRPQYTGIDPFELNTVRSDGESLVSDEKRPRTRAETKALLHRALGPEIASRVDLRTGYSRDVLPVLRQEGRRYDLIFIDGGHSYDDVHGDWEHCQHLLAPGGTAVLDDYPNWGVLPAVSDIDRRQWRVRVLEHHDLFQAVEPSDDYPTHRRMFHLVEVTRAGGRWVATR